MLSRTPTTTSPSVSLLCLSHVSWPNDRTEMHQYLDSDGSGTSPTCVSPTIGAERLAAATAWLKANNLKGFLGEIGSGSNSVCISAVRGALCSMQQSGVWIGATWWAAGPWWGDVRIPQISYFRCRLLTGCPFAVLPIHRASQWCCNLADSA